MKKIRVMIVEDSDVVREFLLHIIAQDPRLEVIAATRSAEEALRLLRGLTPDVISMDIHLPGISGLEATRRIMSEKPTPIVVVAAGVGTDDSSMVMDALRAGALTVLEKPVGTTHQDYAAMAERLCTQLAIMSEVKVVSQRGYRNFPPVPKLPAPPASRLPAGHDGAFCLLGITASTGGPSALVQLLGGLGENFPLPICLVQHINTNFLEGFVRWLSDSCPFKVVIATEGEKPVPGKVYVAPPDRHLIVTPLGRLGMDTRDPVCAQRPSGSVLFESMARASGGQAIGVLLTGMGADGADGLLALREAGGYTLAEDASTAVVYGMPAVAVRLGAVRESLPLPAIAPRILGLLATEEMHP
jgi:two-component system chemotaxis response regulator CheB